MGLWVSNTRTSWRFLYNSKLLCKLLLVFVKNILLHYLEKTFYLHFYIFWQKITRIKKWNYFAMKVFFPSFGTFYHSFTKHLWKTSQNIIFKLHCKKKKQQIVCLDKRLTTSVESFQPESGVVLKVNACQNITVKIFSLCWRSILPSLLYRCSIFPESLDF